MANNLTFKSVCKYLSDSDDTLLSDIDLLLNLTILITPIISPINVAAILNAFQIIEGKNELKKTVSKILNKLSVKKTKNGLERMLKLENAYGLICYSAFFDAISTILSKIDKNYIISDNLKYDLLELTFKKNEYDNFSPSNYLAENNPTEIEIPFPKSTNGLVKNIEILKVIYSGLGKNLLSIIQKTDSWQNDEISDNIKNIIRSNIDQLPIIAAKHFEAQFIQLCTMFNDFYLWTNILENRSLLSTITDNNKDNMGFIQELLQRQEQIDIGLNNLGRVLSKFPKHTCVNNKATIQQLITYYKADINDPIIKDNGIKTQLDQTISFPLKKNIFIPQSFKLLPYNTELSVEDRDLWKTIPSSGKEDIGLFIYNFISSPGSQINPLLILGDPGVGKSLLCSFVATEIAFPEYLPIIIKLRGINTDKRISEQIEEAVYQQIERRIMWQDIILENDQRNILLIFDGLDELIQNSPKSFSEYISKLKDFQVVERTISSANIKIIVTSRINLLSKSIIPENSTILMLEPFDNARIIKWVEIWNRHNHSAVYLDRLLDDDKLRDIIKYPLLLMLMSIYQTYMMDSVDTFSKNRVTLYYDILKMFVERQIRKDYPYGFPNSISLIEKIENELNQLGIVAIGMYNRTSLLITTSELDDDLSYFRKEKEISNIESDLISPGELTLGKFFFIHRSTITFSAKGNKTKYLGSSYEFMHTTFQEYFVADFILNALIEFIKELAPNPNRTRRIANPNSFDSLWYIPLMYSPLFRTPNIINLLIEWLPKKLELKDIDTILFEDMLADICRAHISAILNDNQLPHLFIDKSISNYPKMPLMGYLSTYTINIVILNCALSRKRCVFFDDFTEKPNHVKLWDKLTHLWRSYYSLDDLVSFTNIFKAIKEDDSTKLVFDDDYKKNENTAEYLIKYNVNTSLSDLVAADLDKLFFELKNGYEIALQKAEEIDKFKLNLFTNLTHEIRTPMNGILGYSEVLADIIEDEVQKRMINAISLSGRRLLETLSNILSISDIESRRINTESTIVDIRETLVMCYKEFTDQASRKNLTLECTYPEHPIWVNLDQELLIRALHNLLNNALKFTLFGGITINVYQANSFALIDISDTGIGIEENKQLAIFDEFRQGSEGLGRGYEGLGLGLTLSKKYVELMNGTISVESILNVGSTFTISFPISEQQSL